MIPTRLYSLVALSFALVATASPRPHTSNVAKKTVPHTVKKTVAHTGKKTAPKKAHVRSRSAFDNTVKVFSADHYCDPHVNIGDSEHPGGMQSFCSAPARDNDSQGVLPEDFWSESEYKWARGPQGGKYVQLTGCIRPETIDRLNRNDGGGQYDSSGGEGGRGNPRDSVCAGFNHYIEIIEPSQKRACIRCCEDFDDCPVHKGELYHKSISQVARDERT
ncbi:hypothetical protein D9756_002980 [Leucocoprinus leucothites]|uniref:Secreted protein n=1 Tax=Leucocoprinus leucothites TaxID=201217 RepID=A0A8H5LJ66_9AGAR|nr:hypothetical protein D9756_002980 [Leucoagaricus leucothites]